MQSNAADCVKRCLTCQQDRQTPRKPAELLKFIDKGSAPLQGWSIDSAGPFPIDDNGNKYLLTAIDPFSKWVEA